MGFNTVLKRLKYKDVKPIYKIDEYGNIFSEYKNNYLNPKKDKDGYLSLALVGKNRTIYVRVATFKEIAKIYNVDKSTISNIKRKKSWKYISKRYNFPEIIIKRKKGKFARIEYTQE